MDDQSIKLAADTIASNLINQDFHPSSINSSESTPSNRALMFEQYKMLVDSAQRIEERRGGSNGIFIGINTILVSVLLHTEQLSKMQFGDMFLAAFLALIGILISWDWLKVISSYKNLNSLNYTLMKSFENILPTRVFSLRGKIENEQQDSKLSNRANIILISENLLPKTFLVIYSVYLLMIFVIFYKYLIPMP
jgi:hypothetical protein